MKPQSITVEYDGQSVTFFEAGQPHGAKNNQVHVEACLANGDWLIGKGQRVNGRLDSVKHIRPMAVDYPREEIKS